MDLCRAGSQLHSILAARCERAVLVYMIVSTLRNCSDNFHI